jgi:hypothetical protein
MEQLQNSYRLVTKYLEVFSCVFLHDYYESRVCNDLTFKPTPQTNFLLKNYNLIFKPRAGGFALAANSERDFSNAIYKDPFVLDFEFKFTNIYFHSYTVLVSDPEVRYFLDDNLEATVQLDAKQGTIDPELDRPGLSGIIRIKHHPYFPILPIPGAQGRRFYPRSKEVVFKNRMIRPVYLCYCSEERVSDFQGLIIENEGEFKGVLEFGSPELVTTDSGLIAYKFIANQNIPMKFLWKGYFRLERTNQLGVYRKTLPNPSPKSLKYDPGINAYISENFVKL